MANSSDLKALIVFVDIRGFTVWSENVGNAAILDEFVEHWYKILDRNFTDATLIKHLGDGAMIVQEMPEKTTAKILKDILSGMLKKVYHTGEEFGKFCKKLSEEEGTKIPLFLGWGIAKGPVKKINGDYIGSDINKCSRFCDIARPFGIVIDADDFQSRPVQPGTFAMEFSKQTRLLKGIHDDCDVWVTREIAEQFIPREDLRENPEVHVAGICFKKEHGKLFVLLGQRKKGRKLFPLLYEGCGGQLAYNELFHEGVRRHYEKEYHIEVKVRKDIFSFYEINTNNEPKIPGIRFLCEYRAGTPSSLNHIPPTPKWFTETEFKLIPKEKFIPGLKDEIAEFFSKYKKLVNVT
jgi:class 3 adenylate cyclase